LFTLPASFLARCGRNQEDPSQPFFNTNDRSNLRAKKKSPNFQIKKFEKKNVLKGKKILIVGKKKNRPLPLFPNNFFVACRGCD
jgi:hypothetical protein